MTLDMEQATYDMVKEKLGASGANKKIVATDALVKWAWDQPDGWVIVPFDQLSPRLKVLQIDGWNIFHAAKGDDPYPLAFAADSATNYDLDQLTTVAITGVTAMTRATARKLDENGTAWAPADIAPALADADFVHASNEVSFTEDCPRSGKTLQLGDFCSKDSYL